MAWYHKFPWTNIHELNLDWILDIVKRAEDALPGVEKATEDANSAAALANNNAIAASDAATRANTAARNIDPITATAATVYGAGASVTVEDSNPGKVFHFLIPAGEKGDPGPAGGAGDLIDNGNFTNPVNQRKSSEYDGSGAKKYTIDRWYTTSSVSKAVVVNNKYITVATGATISQIIPADQDGSFPSDTDVGYTAVARETNGTLHVATSNITDSKLSFAIGDANSGITVTLGSGNWEYCALYRGSYTASNVPGYVAKEYATQLTACMRYYQAMSYHFNKRYVSSNGAETIPVMWYIPMRINPTVDTRTSYSSNVATGPTTGSVSNYGMTLGFVSTSDTSALQWDGFIEASADL